MTICHMETAQVVNLEEVASAQTLAAREPILRYINFQSSPTQIRVLWLYGKIGMVSHPDNLQFYKGLRLMPQHFHHQNHLVFKNTCQNISLE